MTNDYEKIQAMIRNVERVIVGKRAMVELVVTALLAEGHILLEDVPGVGKTMMVRAFAKSIEGDFKRIQFTPDLLPSDVIGVSIYNPKELSFEFRPGPIMGNIILADEINRASPRTQSALLESMEEQSMTVDGNTIVLEKPFLVIATQNPIEHEGTYPLPEAQLDRFLLKLKMGYPSREEELTVLQRAIGQEPIEQIEAVMTRQQLVQLQRAVKEIAVQDHVKHYIIDCARATREHPSIQLGVSPRGSIALMKACQAYAFIQGRAFVTPDDVQYMMPFVCTHRIVLGPEAMYDGKDGEQIIREVIQQIPVPVERMSR
ncbi:MAG TPA: MoxR family ATPase [Sporosarcina sp.]|nr:MoxR family ATPase [Sporosarcina sp.]